MRQKRLYTILPHHSKSEAISFWVALLLLALVGQGCADKDIEGEGMGRFEANEATVTALSSGELTQWNVTEGQQVERGMVLGMIENTQLLMQREELHSSLQQLESDRRMVSARKESAKQRLEDLEKQAASLRQQIAEVQAEKAHYEELFEKGVVARNQVDAFDVRLDVLTRQLALLDEQIGSTVVTEEESSGLPQGEAELRAKELETQLAQIDNQLTGIQVATPITGTIIEKHVQLGDYVNAGKELFRVADLTKMTLRAHMSESSLDQVKLGQKVQVSVDTGVGNPPVYEGIVMWVSANSEFASNKPAAQPGEDAMHAVKIKVVNDGRISIGMKGRVMLEE